MTKINMDELIADREAGTGGSWRASGESVMEGLDYIIAMVMSDDEADADARRIARLPDLEAAYLEAVERQGRQYHIGPLTFDRVFRAGQLENLYDMQAVLDAVERALEAE